MEFFARRGEKGLTSRRDVVGPGDPSRLPSKLRAGRAV
jgi:hypothetical protein